MNGKRDLLNGGTENIADSQLIIRYPEFTIFQLCIILHGKSAFKQGQKFLSTIVTIFPGFNSLTISPQRASVRLQLFCWCSQVISIVLQYLVISISSFILFSASTRSKVSKLFQVFYVLLY